MAKGAQCPERFDSNFVIRIFGRFEQSLCSRLNSTFLDTADKLGFNRASRLIDAGNNRLINTD